MVEGWDGLGDTREKKRGSQCGERVFREPAWGALGGFREPVQLSDGKNF